MSDRHHLHAAVLKLTQCASRASIACVLLVILVLPAMVTLCRDAHAFGVLGHHIVAAIAERNLAAGEIAAVRAALLEAGIGGGDMIRASTFPDEYRIAHPE